MGIQQKAMEKQGHPINATEKQWKTIELIEQGEANHSGTPQKRMRTEDNQEEAPKKHNR